MFQSRDRGKMQQYPCSRKVFGVHRAELKRGNRKGKNNKKDVAASNDIIPSEIEEATTAVVLGQPTASLSEKKKAADSRPAKFIMNSRSSRTERGHGNASTVDGRMSLSKNQTGCDTCG